MASTTTTPGEGTTAPTPDPFDAAFAAAAASQEGASSTAPGEEGEQPEAPATTEEEAEPPAEETEGEGQPTEAPATEGTEPEAKTEAQAPATDQDERVGKLLAQLPKPLQKEWNKLVTQRQQKLAAQEKLLTALATDPVAAAKEILAAHELPAAPVLDTTAVATKLAAALGNEDQAKALAPVLAELVNAAVKPISDQNALAERNRNLQASQADIEKFSAEHPDFDENDPAMNEWFDRMGPAAFQGKTTYETLGILRTLAYPEKVAAEKVKSTTKRMVANAKAAGPASKPVPGASVKAGPPSATPTLEQAFASALEGKTWGKGIGI